MKGEGMKMDILLVQCRPKHELNDFRYQSENLALGYLAASLREAQYETGVLDAHLLMLTPEQTVQEILDKRPWMVGISASAQDNITATFEVVGLLRKNGYAGHITIGGHFPTYEHDKILTHVPGIDSVVRGEGEITVVELAEYVKDGKPLDDVKGITFRNCFGEIVVNPDRPLVEDLDTLPLPHRDTIGILLEKNRRISMLASRGCYARCSFCSIQSLQLASQKSEKS
jgi:anaerobic magnesium-protoporphyrin IX monomethyl ester cyclase